MLIEHRTYTAYPGKLDKQIADFEKYGLKVQKRHFGDPVAWLVPETGDMNSYVHIWGFRRFCRPGKETRSACCRSGVAGLPGAKRGERVPHEAGKQVNDAGFLRSDQAVASTCMNILETTQEIYHAFGNGDVAFMLSKFSDDVVLEPWATTAVESGKVPYYKARRGKAGAKEFYASMSAVELKGFKVNGFMAGDNHVCARVSIEFTVKATGKVVRDEELHLWTFDDRGLIISLQHFGDTAKHIEANTK